MSPAWLNLVQGLLLTVGEINTWLEEGNRIILLKADGSSVTLSKAPGEKLKVTVCEKSAGPDGPSSPGPG